MNKLLKLLYEEAQPEAKKNDVYGQYLFAPERTDTPKEPNTEAEKRLYAALEKYFDENDSHKLQTQAPKILQLLADNKYKPLLDPGEITVYRGLRYPLEKLKELIEPYGETIKYNKYVVCNFPDSLSPMIGNVLQSWTSEKNIGAFFGIPHFDESIAGIVFVARTNTEGNSFFGKPMRLAKVVWPDFAFEHETISVGPVEYDGFVYYVYNRTPGKPNLGYDQEKMIEALKKVH